MFGRTIFLFPLDEIMRQKDDSEYAELLNRLREGKHTKNYINKIKTRITTNIINDDVYPMFSPQIFLKNDVVNNFNRQIYENAPEGQKISITAWDTRIGDASTYIK